MEQMQEFETEARNDLIEGRNAVIEALRAGRTIDKIFIAKGDVDKTLGHIASKARSAGIVVTEADRRKLDAMSQTHAHQGVIALCAVKEYSTIEDMLAVAAERDEAPFLVLCDEISDPHNLGAIIRTAECVGAHGVIIPKRRSAGLTAIVDKASAGALEHMAIARVPNLVAAIETLKKNGLWIYGTAAEGSNELWKTDLTGPAASSSARRAAASAGWCAKSVIFSSASRCTDRSPRSMHPLPQRCCSMRRCASAAERPCPSL